MVEPETGVSPRPDRRTLLSRISFAAMAGGLVAGYGGAALMAGRYLYPATPRKMGWLYLAPVGRLAPGESIPYRSPVGETVTIARKTDTGEVADFVALSSTCPHLGCQVHWQAAKARFFCPCHNGVFDPDGKATEGPPADAGQSLLRYRLKIESGLLYIEVPVEGLADARGTDDRTSSPRRA